MSVNQETKPVAGKVKIPAILECGFNQFIEVGNLEAPGIIVVDDLVDRVEGVEVGGQ